MVHLLALDDVLQALAVHMGENSRVNTEMLEAYLLGLSIENR